MNANLTTTEEMIKTPSGSEDTQVGRVRPFRRRPRRHVIAFAFVLSAWPVLRSAGVAGGQRPF